MQMHQASLCFVQTLLLKSIHQSLNDQPNVDIIFFFYEWMNSVIYPLQVQIFTSVVNNILNFEVTYQNVSCTGQVPKRYLDPGWLAEYVFALSICPSRIFLRFILPVFQHCSWTTDCCLGIAEIHLSNPPLLLKCDMWCSVSCQAAVFQYFT